MCLKSFALPLSHIIKASDNLGENNTLKHVFERQSIYLSSQDIQKMQKDAERFREEDNYLKELAEKRNSLKGYMYTIKKALHQRVNLDKGAVEDIELFLKECEIICSSKESTLEGLDCYLIKAQKYNFD